MTRLVAAALLLAAPLLRAQQQPEPIRVEVASIHLHKSTGDDPSNRNVLPGGRFVATATTVQTLIRGAFALDYDAILNAPRWTETELFDITATTANHANVERPEQYQQLLLSLLQDHFGLRFHTEQRTAPVFWLVVDKPGRLGPALRESAPNTPLKINMNGNRTVVMQVTGVTMPEVAKSIQRRAGRTVEDHTGLPAKYDFDIKWAPESTPDSDDAPLPTVLKEQLGLRLQPAKGTVGTVVIDAVSQPSLDQ